MKTSVVIPVFNENDSVHHIIAEARKYVDLVIVVDDGSSEKKQLHLDASEAGIVLLRHKINLGKGAALKTGCEAAIRLKADTIVVMDSDGQHKPEDLKRFINQFSNKEVEIVFGSRKIGKDMPLAMMLGNKFLSLAVSFLFGIYISDTQCGYRAFRASVYPKIKWTSPRYAVETEMITNIAKNKIKYSEIEIATIYADNYKGTTFLDGIKIFINMLIWKFT